jgi:hypothetical protein
MRRIATLICIGCLAATGSHADTTPLHKLASAERQARIASDLAAARVYRNGLRTTLDFVSAHPELFPAEKVKEPRVLERADREAVWSAWKSFLDYTLALDTLGRYHRHYYRLRGAEEDRSFLVAYAAFLAQYRAALEFIDRSEHDRNLDTLLNEPVPELGLPKGTYAKIKLRFLNAGRGAEFVALEAIYKTRAGNDEPAVRGGIDEDRKAIWRMGRGRGPALTAKNALAVVQRAGFTAYFPVQAGVSEWMGDTKVRRRGLSLLSEEQVRQLAPRLEPGDVLLERREWYLSNVGLPGFWPHAALYIGTGEDRRKYFDDAEVNAWVREQGRADGDFEALLESRYPAAYASSRQPQEHGHVPRVIEAISEGVSFTTLEHSTDCDSLAALRPRLSKREKAQAILRAFHYAGRPYDFNFDFRTDSALVCTELVFKSYEPANGVTGLRLSLVEMLGRPVLPANEIVRQFVAENGTPKQQFDLVIFLDGDEKRRRAVEADVKAFGESHTRPKWHILLQEKEASRE